MSIEEKREILLSWVKEMDNEGINTLIKEYHPSSFC